jgi:branched-chain amino acid aminotransferase
MITASTRRVSSESLDPRVKSLNYLNNILAKLEARQAGCLEAVMLNMEGFVAECTGDNIGIIRDGGLLTPSPDCGALDGITMRAVLDIAESAGIKTGRSKLTRYDLYTADECFLTGTGAEIIAVTRIDGRIIGHGRPGKTTRRLEDGFRNLLKQ